jgi:protein-disulfide isomerase
MRKVLMREIWFAAVIGLSLAGALPAVAQAPQPASKAAIDSALAVTKEDRVLGKADAPITIVEYGSLSCPHCAHFTADVLPQLKKKWIDTGKAKLIFRDFPLDQEALRAEMVARCAPPERYYAIVDMLFENQDKWVMAKDWSAALARLVRVAGIGKTEFDACLANKAVEDQVTQSRLSASQQLGVDSTPTFFVNGKKYEGEPTVEAFDQLLSGLAEKS